MDWLTKHGYAFLLGLVVLIATVVSVCGGSPKPPPDVALGSEVLLHVERVFAILIAFLFTLVIVVRGWKGELPNKIGKDGAEYPEEKALEVAREASQGILVAEGDPNEGPVDGSTPKSVLALRLKLEAKLSYIAKYLLADEDCCVTFLNIGSLHFDGYITDPEADTLGRVMTMRDADLEALPPVLKSDFLANADNVVKNIRASVFYGLVREILKDNEWTVKAIPTKRKRADLHAIDAGSGRQFRVVPRFATSEDSPILARELRRLGKLSGERSRRGGVVIVVPDRSKSELDPKGDPAVLKLTEFKDLLGLTSDPRSPKQQA